MAKEEIFVDGIGKIHFVGGLVRYDLVSLEPAEGENKEPERKEKVRVIMPPEGFLATYNTMQRLIDQLVDAGVLSRRNPEK